MSTQTVYAGFFSMLKKWDTKKVEWYNEKPLPTTSGTSEVIVTVNWPAYAGENYLRIYDPSNTLLTEICVPSNCYNGASVSYNTTANLGCLADGAGYYIAMYDSYGDGWNGSGVNVTVTAGGATVINNSGSSATTAGVTESFTVSGGGSACAPSEGPGNTACANNDEIGGVVFEDNNADGLLDNGETYFENISVSLFDDNGQVGTAQTTNSNGEYLFTALTAGQSYRIEFTVPDFLSESPNNTNSKSSVQVVQPGVCDNNLGVFYPEGYCDTSNPPLVISCYEDGNAVYGGTGNDGKSLVSFPYNSSGATPTGISEVAKIYQVGSVWGVAYQATEKKMFASALLKRHVGLGSQGEGGVYVMDFSSGTGSYSTSFNLDGLTPANGGSIINFGSVNRSGTDNQLANDNVTNSWDIDAFGKIGKIGIGDLDLHPDGKTIWLVNLNQRALVTVDVSNPTSYPGMVNQYPLSEMSGVPSCTNGVLRPWALAFKEGKGYVGCVCTGESGGNASDLRAYVLSFDPNNPTTLTTEIDFALDYTRELAVDFPAYGLSNAGTWMPWASTWGDTGFGNTPGAEIAYAQPILGEIDFLDDGAMVLGFSDRFGFQMGAGDYIPVSGSTVATSVDAAGDLIKVCNVGGAWVMEGSSGCGENDSGTKSALTNDGPSGTGEFFYSDAFDDTGQSPTYNHNETFIGGLKVLKGTNELIAGHYDPINGNYSFDLGIIWHNTITGARADEFMIIESGASSSKGNNLGSIEAVCAAAPIEIGNYVWNDTDGDGIQDPSENGIAGVTVSFTNDSDVVLGTTTTDSNGEYVFNNANVTGDIGYNSNYKVKINLSDAQAIVPSIQSVSGANQGNGINDNAAAMDGTTAVATLTTGGSGETTYAVDFGFNAVVNNTEVTAFAIQPSCIDNVPNTDGYLQISAVIDGDKVNWVMGSDYAADGGDSDYNNAITIGALPFQFGNGLVNPTGSQDYTIRVFNGSSSSFIDVTLTMNEQNCTVGCNCVENLYLNDTGLGEVHKFSVNPNDGTITEIGSPWLSGLTNPHGLGSDLNGNLYIGDHNQGPVFKLDCDGGTIADNATVWNNSIIEGLTNIGSVGNYIITNGHTNSTSGKDLHVLDACSGDLMGTICLNSAGSGGWSSDWGLQVLSDGMVLVTDGQGFGPDTDRAIWTFQFDPSMINSSTCIDALVSNDYLSGMYDVVGITSDETFLYVLTRDNNSNTTLLKINATTGALVQSKYEGGWDGSGYNGALGLVYAPSSGYIYVSGYEDCIAIVDPSDLSYVGPGNGVIPSGAAPKAIALLKECCPSNNNMVIDTFVTTASLNDSIFLQELINCSGTVCQGLWSQGSNNAGLTYNACANTVRIDAANGCGSFTLSSDGLGKYPQCGAFTITVNIKVIEEPTTSIGNRIWVDEDGDGDQDAGEPGIPNVVVELLDNSSAVVGTTITDADGGYIFKNVATGTYTVQVISGVPTGATLIYDEDDNTTSPNGMASVTITANEYVTADFGYNFSPKNDTDNPNTASTGALGDRVWNDANSNGMQDLGEAGIPNITINLLTDTNLDGKYMPSGTTTTTDAYGNYLFDDLTPGAYAVEVVEADIANAGFTTIPTGDPDSDNNSIAEPVIIAPGDVWLGGDFGYNNSSNPADIGSTVFIDVDADGIFNAANDLPLRQVTVALISDTNGDGDWDTGEPVVATTETALDGSYLFPDLADNNYVVAITDVNNIIDDLTNTVDPDGSNDEYSSVALSGSDELLENFGYVPNGHTAGDGFIGDMIFIDEDGGNDYDMGESGIEGVTVELLNGNDDSVLSSTTTDENGLYFFGGLAADNYKVKVITSSLPSGMMNSIDPDGSSPGDDVTNSFALAAGVSDLTKDFGYKASTPRMIDGTVWEDANAEGILDGTEANRFEDVTVMLLDANNNIIAMTSTDANGDYSFTQIPPGIYTVDVTDTKDSLMGYWHSPTANDNENDPVSVDVTSADQTDIDFGYYKKAASLGNVVWEDANADGLQNNNERGVPAVVVTLEIDYNNDATADITVVTTTDDLGQYSFVNLLLDEDYNGDGAGTEPIYTIKLTTPVGYASTMKDVNINGNDAMDSDDPAGVIASATQGQSDMTKQTDPTTEPIAATYDFGLVQTGVVGNRVWLDEDSDGVQDAGEPGIAGVVLELQNGNCTSGSDCPTTITDANGGYIFRNLLPGSYTVKVLSGVTGMESIFDENDGTTTPNMETPVTITSGGEYVTADFGYNFSSKINTDNPTIASTGALGDRVWNDANSNGVEDSGEAGIDNITVNLYSDHDDDGIFDQLVATEMTDANGNYFFDELTSDAYVVAVLATDIETAGFETTPTGDPDNDASNRSKPVVIAPGDVWMGGDFGYNNSNNPADIGSIVFVDVDGDGSYDAANDLPLGGVTIALVKDTDGGDDWDANEELVATTSTAQDGSYLFPDLPAGDYVVAVTDVDNIINTLSNTVDPQGANDGVSGVTLGASDDLAQNFGYVPAGHTAATAFIGDLIFLDQNGDGSYSSNEAGIEGVEVMLLNGDTDAALARTVTNENGLYFFGGLAAANYKVKVNASSLPAGLTPSMDPDGNAPAGNETISFVVAAGDEILTKDFGYKAATPRTISGTIWEDENAEGTLEGTENARFENVSVLLLNDDANIIAQTKTDASGDYLFSGVPAGSYRVEVTDVSNILGGFWHSPIANDNESDPIVVDANAGNVTDVDFGYYKKAAALGNYVWLDYNYDGIQDADEPGLEGSKITLEIDYDGGGADITVVQLAGMDGCYSFDHLLLDEDYQGDGVGVEPTFTLKVLPPNNHTMFISSANKDTGGNDNLDADNDVGITANPQQGKIDVAITNITEGQSSFDFAFNFDCTQPTVEYAMTMDGSDPNAPQTTNYLLTVVDGDTCHMPAAQKYGRIRSYTYCQHGEWNYYFNPMDPDEYLFAIRHNSNGGGTINTTPIEYIELRMEQNASDRFEVGVDNANFVMMRDWYVKTKDDVALTAPVDIRFYFPENEFADMYNSAINQATNAWGVGSPEVGEVKWFKKNVFNPTNDIDEDGSTLIAYDITSHQDFATDENGNNTEDTYTDGVQNIGQNKNHIQFNGLTGFSGGTAVLPINKSALPVGLSMFEAKEEGCSVRLIWQSESEENFDYYEIQRSGDGQNFNAMESIDGKGGTTTAIYEYIDQSAKDFNYYRLKMVDLDGSYEYSKVVNVETNCTGDGAMKIYPNPISKDDGLVNIEFYSGRDEVQISIVDMLGRTVKSISIEVEREWNAVRLDISDLPSGAYRVQVAGEKASKMLVVQE